MLGELAQDDRRTRAIHCFRSPVGGLFRHVRDQVQFQNTAGVAVGIVCDENSGGEEAARVLESLAPVCELGVHRFPISRNVGPGDFLSFLRMTSVCRNASPNIIHGHGAKGGALARLVAHRVGALAVYTPHGGALHYDNRSIHGSIFLAIERFFRRKTDGLIFESRFAKQAYLAKVSSSSCPNSVIHNGLTMDEFVPLAPTGEEYDFVFVGELRYLKGLVTLFDALALLRKQKREFRLLMAGDGPQRAWCLEKIEQHGFQNNIDVVMPVHPARLAFARGRCVLVPSLRESLPYVVLEAAASERPQIVSRAGGIAEIYGSLDDCLVTPGDATELANAMSAFLDDPSAAIEIARALKTHVEHNFSVDQMGQRTIDMYQELRAGSA